MSVDGGRGLRLVTILLAIAVALALLVAVTSDDADARAKKSPRIVRCTEKTRAKDKVRAKSAQKNTRKTAKKRVCAPPKRCVRTKAKSSRSSKATRRSKANRRSKVRGRSKVVCRRAVKAPRPKAPKPLPDGSGSLSAPAPATSPAPSPIVPAPIGPVPTPVGPQPTPTSSPVGPTPTSTPTSPVIDQWQPYDVVPAVGGDADVFVRVSGDDAVGDGSRAKPFRTLGRALAAVGDGGGVIEVGAGEYPKERDMVARTQWVTVRGAPGEAPPQLDGFEVAGGRKLRLEWLSFTRPVEVSYHPTRLQAQRAADIEIEHSSITSGGSPKVCLGVANIDHVVVRASTIHDCVTGLTIGAGLNDALVEGNLLEHFVQDGVNITGSTGVVFRANRVRDMHDPAGQAHNDAIQLTGRVSGLVIDGNVLSDSHHQLLMMQDNNGPIDDVLVQNNVLTGGGGYAAQAEHVTNLRFVNNTVWGNWSGIAIRNRVGTPTTDTVVVNNVLQGLSFREGTTPARVQANVTGPCSAPVAGMLCATTPIFQDEATRDYRPAAGSPALKLANPADAPAFDLNHKPRTKTPTAGAYE